MSDDASDIAIIPDYVASVAAGLTGVRAAYGTGTGSIDDPLRPGKKIATAGSNDVETFAWWTDMPGAPSVRWMTQTGTVELTWIVVSRLWLPKEPVEELRYTAMPFYDRILRAYIVDRQLGGLVSRTEIQSLAIGQDEDFSWLETRLMAVEVVRY